MTGLKRTVPLLIAALAGLVLILAKFVPALGELGDMALVPFDILAAIAFILGGGNLLRSHGTKIFRRNAGWGYSAVTLLAFLATLTIGLFKVGVTGRPGCEGDLSGPGGVVGLVQLDLRDLRRSLTVKVYGAPPGTRHTVRAGERELGEVAIDERGRGVFGRRYDPPADGSPAADTPGAGLLALSAGDAITVGTIAAGWLEPYAPLTGEFNEDGGAFWYVYQYAMSPLQSTMFALLAFFMASAAFRAFRARNVESVLLLGTAFIVLLGATHLGEWLTGWLPDNGAGAFFQIPNLRDWIMQTFNTAGSRAIMIGVALGIASTSLRVLLGLDRSYLGSDKG